MNFGLHSNTVSGVGSLGSSADPPYTTLPPIFTARTAGANTRRSGPRVSARVSTRQVSGSGFASRLRPTLKAPIPEFRPNKSAREVQMQVATGGGGVDAPGAPSATSTLGRKIASNAEAASQQKKGGQTRNNNHHNTNDEATIGPDGTVSFGPNLSLLMSSLAVRFGDVDHDDGDTPPAGRSHRARAHSGGGSMHADSLHSPLSSLTSRKRTDAKKREWAAMNALFSKAMEDKQTSKEQQQWFMARFNYPLIHQPSTAPNMPHHPPNSHPNHPHPPTGDLNTHAPTNEHVHLLHSSHIAYEKGAYLEEAKQEYERR